MRNSIKLKSTFKDNNSFAKNNNHSLKSLDQTKRLKQIFQFCQKSLVSKSTMNISKKQVKSNRSPRYYKKDQPSVQNRLLSHKNKQNIKFPQIVKSNIIISSENLKKKNIVKNVQQSSKKLITQPVLSNISRFDHYQERKTDIKQALLQILNMDLRKSITLEDQINKLHKLTRKSGSLRNHLRSIQEDVLSINLKKKLRKISAQNCSLII